jgi:putative serine protease PepD
LLGAVVAFALIAGGDGHSAARVEPLPAVARKPVQPRKGQTRAGAIYALASPAVVSIRTDSGSGTGFLVDRRDTIVTNAHVVGSADHVAVRFGTHGRTLDGRVLGVDRSSDLAIVRVDASAVPADAKPLELADSSLVRVGDTAIAIGNPFGLDRTATEGIVSALGRQIEAPNGFQIDDIIQTDAPINPGNSGGPLLDDAGHVIGVTTQIATSGNGSDGNVGIGFAVSSNTVRAVVPRLEKGETIARAWLGVEAADAPDGNGALIGSVMSGGPAEDAGLRPRDVITSIDDRPIDDAAVVSQVIADKRPGDRVKVQFERDGRRSTTTVKLGTRPQSVR